MTEDTGDRYVPATISPCDIGGLPVTGTYLSPFSSEIESLLGRPPETGYFDDWDYVYRLGMERGPFSIDSEWLVLRLGADQRVSEWAVVSD